MTQPVFGNFLWGQGERVSRLKKWGVSLGIRMPIRNQMMGNSRCDRIVSP